MSAYPPQSQPPYNYDASGVPQPPQVQVQPAMQAAEPPHLSSNERSRGYSNGSYNGATPQPPPPQQYAQQGAYAGPAQPQYAPPGQQASSYFPPPPASSQLVPAQAFGGQQLRPEAGLTMADPYGHRRRTSSSASHASRASRSSHHSHHSHHSSASHRSGHSGHSRHNDRVTTKPGERIGFGDTLVFIWEAMRDMIPVGKR